MSVEQPPGSESLKVEKLSPDSRGVNTTVKVVTKGLPRETVSRTDGSTHRVADVLVGDETACIYLTMWDDNIDKVKEGDIIDIKNGYVSLFRGSMRLNIGRQGTLEASQQTIGEVNTQNNLSDKKFEQERRFPSFRPSYQDRGGGRGYGRDRGYGRRGGGGGYGRGRRRY